MARSVENLWKSFDMLKNEGEFLKIPSNRRIQLQGIKKGKARKAQHVRDFLRKMYGYRWANHINHSELSSQSRGDLFTKIQAHPALKERIEVILDLLENESEDLSTVNEVNSRIREETEMLAKELWKERIAWQRLKSVENSE